MILDNLIGKVIGNIELDAVNTEGCGNFEIFCECGTAETVNHCTDFHNCEFLSLMEMIY